MAGRIGSLNQGLHNGIFAYLAEQPGWRTRGHGDVGAIRGVMCHHTAGPLTGNMPSLHIVTEGRAGPVGPARTTLPRARRQILRGSRRCDVSCRERELAGR
jgi:hypothetical protein